jgi:hypothetical protein
MDIIPSPFLLPTHATLRFIDNDVENVDRQVPRKPRLVGGVKGHKENDIRFLETPRRTGGELQNRINDDL